MEPQASTGADTRRRDFLLRVGVAPDHADVALSPAFALTAAAKAVLGFAQDPSTRTLVLWGGVGSGKTVAAARWFLELPRCADPSGDSPDVWTWLSHPESTRTLFVPAYELGSLDRFAERDRARWERIKRARYLVVDDLGAEGVDIRTRVDELLYHRTSRPVFTAFTTNLECVPRAGSPASAFEQRYGSRVVSRIEEHGRFWACGSVDLRRRRSAS